MTNNDEKVIKDAQYRKGLSIAFFNATNAAIALITGPRTTLVTETSEETKEKIVELRDWFLAEHKKYYAQVIANVGTNYSVEDSIAKLRTVKTRDELQMVWQMFSADERHNIEIKKVAQEMKKSFDEKV